MDKFYLDSNEHNLLLNALSSNNPNGDSLNDQALAQHNILNKGSSVADPLALAGTEWNDSSFLDGSIDPGHFNWDLNDGLLQSQNSASGGESPSADGDGSEEQYSGSDKRKKSQTEAPDGSPESKRRDSEGGKEAKKPGRKPLTSEPTSKRKAQNRAAQRAFRERKEQHLKDLANKIEDLEKASEDTNHENGVLRAQVEQLQTAVKEYQKRLSTGGPSAANVDSVSLARHPMGSASKINWDVGNSFDFEFPSFGTTSDVVKRNIPSTLFRTAAEASPAHGLRMSTGDGPEQRSGSSSETQDSSISTESAAMSPCSYGVGSSCVTTPEPTFASPGPMKSAVPRRNSNFSQNGQSTSPQSNGQSSELPPQPKTPTADTPDLGWLALQNGGAFDPVLFGDWREPQDNILNSNISDLSFFDDAFTSGPDFSTPFYAAPNPNEASKAPQAWDPTLVTTAVLNAEQANRGGSKVPPSKELIHRVDSDAAGDSHMIRFSDESHITCSALWDRVQNSQRVVDGETDMDDLCFQLKSKAKCSGNGAVIAETDVDAILGPTARTWTSPKKGLSGMLS